ncbi:MAG: diguanylate cyclase [Thermoanaerobaculia bacterium]|jgi:diguanylate cyclase (GGDEF)-like protein|nr:diguanylate cyclase [Thermoanaerobaculia bacterium]
MELLLWRWSTAAQFTSAVMIAVFFVVLARSVRRAELQPWAAAWSLNVLALLIPISFWFLRPESTLLVSFMRGGYFLSKTLCIALLVIGAMRFVGGSLALRPDGRLLIIVAVYSALAALLVSGINQAGALQSGVTAIVLTAGAVLIFARHATGSGWLACGFAARALLAIVETAAYFSRIIPSRWSSSATIGIFLSSHSSLDAAAESVIALGCVLVFYHMIQNELTQLNRDLLHTQTALRELVEIDPLTGLQNRRSLLPALAASATTGATVLFFDLDDFKAINDRHGHQAGDDCLRRFAAALKASFSPQDQLARYAGDEFVVVARDAGSDQIQASIRRLRELLRADRVNGPDVHFAVGQATLAVGGRPEEALRNADAAMYEAKRQRDRRNAAGPF